MYRLGIDTRDGECQPIYLQVAVMSMDACWAFTAPCQEHITTLPLRPSAPQQDCPIVSHIDRLTVLTAGGRISHLHQIWHGGSELGRMFLGIIIHIPT